MAAGASKQQIGRAIYRNLKKAAAELGGQYFPASRDYYGYVLVGDVKISYSVLRASNGECALQPFARNQINGAYASGFARFQDLVAQVAA